MVLIAKKREVIAKGASFPWSECQVMRLATKHKAYRFNMNSGFFCRFNSALIKHFIGAFFNI